MIEKKNPSHFDLMARIDKTSLYPYCSGVDASLDTLFLCVFITKGERNQNEHIYLKCPNCGGDIEVEDGLDTCFCKYCGYKMILEGQSDASYRAKTRIKEMEHIERMEDKKYENARYFFDSIFKPQTQPELNKQQKVALIIGAATLLVIFLIFGSVKISSDNQEKELQNIVTEIQSDIKNKDYEIAYIKAQSIKYTVGWNNDTEAKWDSIREEIIAQISRAESEDKGETTVNQNTD